VYLWTGPRDGKPWHVDTGLPDSLVGSVWNVAETGAHGVIVRFCRPESPETLREVYYASPTSLCDPGRIPEQQLMSLLDRATGPAV
jgi:hypothetical protein